MVKAVEAKKEGERRTAMNESDRPNGNLPQMKGTSNDLFFVPLQDTHENDFLMYLRFTKKKAYATKEIYFNGLI